MISSNTTAKISTYKQKNKNIAYSIQIINISELAICIEKNGNLCPFFSFYKRRGLKFELQPSSFNMYDFLHHTAHATHAGSAHRHFWLILFLFHDNTLGCEEHTCY